MKPTVFAPATAPGRAALAVVRISGPDAGPILRAICGKAPAPRRATLCSLKDANGDLIDRGLAVFFPGPGSYTGEDMAELQVHGGAAVVDRLVETLLDAGLALASPGEFTRRAFANGKLDLSQAEAVADLIEAQTSAQARQAVAQLEGALGRRYEAWRTNLIEALAHLEAAVDFPDEDLPEAVAERARRPIATIADELASALADSGRGQSVRDGYRIAILGEVNAGKSTLFNGLLDRQAAIVTPVAGSTRDVIEASLVVSGYLVLVADMAGIRLASDEVEAEGVRRAIAWARGANLRIWMVDGGTDGEAWRGASDLVERGDILLVNKLDLPAGTATPAAQTWARAHGLTVQRISLVAGDLSCLRNLLVERVVADLAGSEFPAATRARHVADLRAAHDDLVRALAVLGEAELAAEDVRRACRALGRVTGRIGVDDVLERVFSTFCIGK